ncbi:hypothetical protein FCULG_00006279, partial [Fusarium culmorum]
MTIIKDMPLKCWDCLERFPTTAWKRSGLSSLEYKRWHWRPEGYQGIGLPFTIVCKDCAEYHLERGGIMIRQFNWEFCAICHNGTPDHYAICDNGLPIPTGNSFHLSCFVTSNMFENEQSLSLGREKYRDLIPIAAARFVELNILFDGDEGILNVGEYIRQEGWEHNRIYYKVGDVLDVRYAAWSSNKYYKQALISWRLFTEGGDSNITFRCWESYINVFMDSDICTLEQKEKADRMFKEKRWLKTIFE